MAPEKKTSRKNIEIKSVDWKKSSRSNSFRAIWSKVFKNQPSKICGRHPLKNLKWYGPPKHFNHYHFNKPYRFSLFYMKRKSSFLEQIGLDMLYMVIVFLRLKIQDTGLNLWQKTIGFLIVIYILTAIFNEDKIVWKICQNTLNKLEVHFCDFKLFYCFNFFNFVLICFVLFSFL